MSTPKPLPTPDPVESKPVEFLSKPELINWNQVDAKFEILKKFHSEFAGKKNHNPFLYWKHNIEPLRQEYIKAQKSKTLNKELFDKIMEIPMEAPTIDKFPDQNLFTTLITSPEAMKQIQQTQAPIDMSKMFE